MHVYNRCMCLIKCNSAALCRPVETSAGLHLSKLPPQAMPGAVGTSCGVTACQSSRLYLVVWHSKVALYSILEGNELGHVVHYRVGQNSGHCALLPAPLRPAQTQLVVLVSLPDDCPCVTWHPHKNGYHTHRPPHQQNDTLHHHAPVCLFA